MPSCYLCKEEFSNTYDDNGIIRDFSKRKYCANCRPVGAAKPRNSKKVIHSHCVVCSKPLSGRQTRFCSMQCKTHRLSSYPKQKERGYIRKLELIELAGGACSKCGYDKNLSAFHFHHLDPSKKKFLLDSRAVASRPWELVLEEFKKCILLCGNCHAEVHHPDMIYEKLKIEFEGIEVY